MISTSQKGYTLLELSAVIVLMLVFFALSIPMFNRTLDSAPMNITRKLHNQLSDVRLQAITKGNKVKLEIDPEKKFYQFLVQDRIRYTPHPKYKSKEAFPKGIFVDRLGLGEPQEETYFEPKKLTIFIEPTGFVEIFHVRFRDEDSAVPMQVINVLGKSQIGEEIEI